MEQFTLVPGTSSRSPVLQQRHRTQRRRRFVPRCCFWLVHCVGCVPAPALGDVIPRRSVAREETPWTAPGPLASGRLFRFFHPFPPTAAFPLHRRVPLPAPISRGPNLTATRVSIGTAAGFAVTASFRGIVWEEHCPNHDRFVRPLHQGLQLDIFGSVPTRCSCRDPALAPAKPIPTRRHTNDTPSRRHHVLALGNTPELARRTFLAAARR
ncbi:hypothetical protein IWX90DRAFT_310727 [Phyllosticta citrichinensis]|uniref:Secreted protein n=1 Tax=Phyllosticta citrichinensis TaxID=1130410 RepID=A0ABR1XLY6_9PEZI